MYCGTLVTHFRSFDQMQYTRAGEKYTCSYFDSNQKLFELSHKYFKTWHIWFTKTKFQMTRGRVVKNVHSYHFRWEKGLCFRCSSKTIFDRSILESFFFFFILLPLYPFFQPCLVNLRQMTYAFLIWKARNLKSFFSLQIPRGMEISKASKKIKTGIFKKPKKLSWFPPLRWSKFADAKADKK